MFGVPVYSESLVKKFLCLNCESRFEESIEDELNQEIFCLNCQSVNLMPFRQKSGCSKESCSRSADPSKKSNCSCH